MMVYLVEDSLLVRQRLQESILEIDPEISIAEAESERDAISGILDRHPDVVVLDLKLEEGSGVEVLRKIRKEGERACIMVFSNHSEPVYRKKCMAMGAGHFFDKMKDFERLIEAIKNFRNKGDR
jgi:DNA-binding NarL/FixJ family response regulator